jgi:hypothetical protein
MRKLVLFLFGLFAVNFIMAQADKFETVWERTLQKGNRPDWFSKGDETDASWTGTERGIVYNPIEEQLYVSSRMGGKPSIRIIDVKTGVDKGTISTLGIQAGGPIAGGGYILNNIQVSDDGQIFACNMTLASGDDIAGALPTDPPTIKAFRVYKWEFSGANPEMIINYKDGGYRLGDKFSVIGDYTKDAVITACPGDRAIVIKWTVKGGIVNPVPKVINLTGITTAGSNITAIPLTTATDSRIYVSGKGMSPTLFGPDGTLISATTLKDRPGSYNGGRILQINKKIFMTQFYSNSTTNETGGHIVDLTKGGENVTLADVYGTSPNLNTGQTTVPGYGAGAVALAVIDKKMYMYVCSPDRGIAAYRATKIDLGTFTGVEDVVSNEVNLTNYPNPFNNSTVIEYNILVKSNENVTIEIYNSTGSLVKKFNEQAKSGKVTFDGSAFAGGVYFCRMSAGNVVKTRPMILSK